jgi:hypothetical protein
LVYQIFKAMMNFLGVSWLVEVVSASEGDSTAEVQSLIFYGENSKSRLSWLCLIMALLKVLFWERRFSLGWKIMISDRATMMLMHCFLHEDVDFGEFILWVLSPWRMCCSYKE